MIHRSSVPGPSPPHGDLIRERAVKNDIQMASMSQLGLCVCVDIYIDICIY